MANCGHGFPITDLLSPEDSEKWILEHFHPEGLKCPWCQADVERANKGRGRGTYANDRPLKVGTIGRSSGQVRLQVVQATQTKTLVNHVHRFTLPSCHVLTDDHEAYQSLQCRHSTVAHGVKEWERDDDRDDVFEVHTNSVEGMWTGLRDFLRPLRGVSKHFLSGYMAIHEFRINLKRVAPMVISALVAMHSFST